MQKSFSELEFAAKKKVTRRERFLRELEVLVHWAAIEARASSTARSADARGPRHADSSARYVFALANLVIAKRRLYALSGSGASNAWN